MDLSYETKYTAIKVLLLKEAQVFGLGFLNNCTSVKRMPLLNILAMCGDTTPVTVLIQDCSKHMKNGGGGRMHPISQVCLMRR